MTRLTERAGNYELQAEYDLIGSLLMSPDQVLPAVRGILSAADFQTETGKAVFQAACELSNEKAEMDVVLIQERGRKNGATLDDELLREILIRFVTPANATETARVIHEAALEREAKNIGFLIMQGELNISDAIFKLAHVQQGQKAALNSPEDDANHFLDTVNGVAAGDIRMYQSTGYKALDRQLGGGMIRNGMIALAARPGVGKTTLGLAIADNVAMAGGCVQYESLEMSKYQLWARRVARYCGVSYARIQEGKLSEGEWKRVHEATAALSTVPFRINDKPTRIDEIEKRAIAEKPDLLVIDHLGLVTPDWRTGQKYQDMTDMSHRIKLLAQTIERPVLTLCQLNRSSEGRQDKRPTMADIRDTGAIEEDADAIILLHRPAYYLPQNERPNPWEAQDIDLIVAKNRHGATGTVTMDFVGSNGKINERIPKRKNSYYEEED